MSSTTSSSSRSIGSRRCSAPSTPTCSRTRAPTRTCAVYQALLQPGDTVLGPEPRPRRSPHARLAGQRQRAAVPLRRLRHRRRGPHRHGRGARSSPLEHRPKMIVAGTTAYPRRLDPEPFRKIADEVGALLMFDIAHLAGLVAGGAHPNPVPFADVVTFTTHKTLRGPRGGADPVHGRVREGDRQGGVPRLAGRAARARHRRRRRSRSARRSIRRSASTPTRSSRTPRRWPAHSSREGFRLVSGGTDNHLMVVDLTPFDAELTGKEAQATARRGRDHPQQEHDPRRSPQPVRHQWRAHRHTVGHHTGHDRAGDGDHRVAHRTGAARP